MWAGSTKAGRQHDHLRVSERLVGTTTICWTCAELAGSAARQQVS